MPECGVSGYIEQIGAYLPVNPTTVDELNLFSFLSWIFTNSITEWLINESRKTQTAFHKRHTEIYFALRNKTSPPPAPDSDTLEATARLLARPTDAEPSTPQASRLLVREESARPLTRQELEWFRNPFAVFGKTSEVGCLVFKVIKN
ncbi:hypothetical protein HYDPIDRAFT_27069 [Hydnomerulius pinastri MD-312]|nr:hypothetical protein HYDPIDRAFT_27069 [Hydnomerulius pinastri MD-312]